MHTFEEWAQHYGYDLESPGTLDDYGRYKRQLETLEGAMPMPVKKQYHIVSDKGFWLPKGYGYTQDIKQAGIFTLAEMEPLQLDGCTLQAVEPSLLD